MASAKSAFVSACPAMLRQKVGKNWLIALVNFYLKERMEVDLCEACELPSLTADAMRGDDETRVGYETDLQKLARIQAKADLKAGLGMRASRGSAYLEDLLGASTGNQRR
jgi:hypothetical protein